MIDDGIEVDGRRIVRHPILDAAPAARSVLISFDGRPIEAIEGEPIAAALLAAGIRVFRTMPRTGQARGGYCFVGRCADCLIIVDGEPNVMACTTPARDGMSVETQHGLGTWPATETAP